MNADDITPLAVAVLSLLDERDMHPYEMIQTLRERKEDQWVKLRTGSLYHQIERLVAAELAQVAGSERDGNRPPRTIYRITDSGRGVLGRWVERHLVEIENPYFAFSLALGEVATLAPQQARTALADREAALTQAIDEARDGIDRANSDGAQRIWMLAHEHHLALLTTERDLVSSLIHDIDTKELTWPTHP